MSESTKWAISQGIELELLRCCESCGATIIVASWVSNGVSVVQMRRIEKSGIIMGLDGEIDDLVEQVRQITTIPPYVIHAGYKNN